MLDFGNGMTAGGTSRDAVRIVTHVGLDTPTWDSVFQERGVMDGGTFVTTRAGTRAMSVTMTTTAYTRDEILRAFMRGQRYTLRAGEASIPYYVEAIGFATANQRGPVRFTVALRSPDAYPSTGTTVAAFGTSSAMAWPHEWPHAYDAMTATDSVSVEVGTDGLAYVETEPLLQLKPTAGGTLTVTHPGGVFALPVSGGDDVVIDSAQRTVTVNGVLTMTTYAQGSAWPVLFAGWNTLSFSPTVMLQMAWPNYVVGLL